MADFRINGDRLIRGLHELRQFGAVGAGVVRPAYSPVDMVSRRWLVREMQEAGLQAQIDGVGNVLGHVPGVRQALLMGSHSDTQPEGGWLDGAMGVMYALEIARSALEQFGTRYPIDVASWMDEEGCYLTCLGSRSFCEQLPEEELALAVDAGGQSVSAAIEAAGLGGLPRLRLDPARHIGYFEAHIEQGCVLERSGKRIGVVTSIVGGAAFRVTFTGEQNHAGTTPMSMRRDAGMACIELAHAVHSGFRQLAGGDTVWTVGDIRFSPGAVNTIAGRAEFALEFRDTDVQVIDRLMRYLEMRVAEFDGAAGVTAGIARLGEPIAPSRMDSTIQDHIAAAAERRAPGAWMHMPSGAGHDAAVLSERVPSGMLFVPSIGGISHSFDEHTSEEDIVLGCQVLADAARSYIEEHLDAQSVQ